jgi:hypothetical protein
MALNFNTISNFFQSSTLGKVNENFTRILTEFGKKLPRDGSEPMTGDLDMNSNTIYNLKDAELPHEAVNLRQLLLYGGSGDGGGEGPVVVVPSTGSLSVSWNDYLDLDEDGTENTSFAAVQIAAALSNKWVEFSTNPNSSDGSYRIGVRDQNAVGYEALTGNLLSGTRMVGIPGVSKIKHLPDYTHCLSCDPVGAGYKQDAFKDIILMDFDIVGEVETAGFGEYQYLINLNGVTNVTIDNVNLYNFKGDGIYLGSGNIGGGSHGRHNKNVAIQNLTIDGFNRNNRNGISVLNCDGLAIRNVKFKNLTRPGNGNVTAGLPFDINTGVAMPGAIDFEPNATDAQPVLRNVVLDQISVQNCGGGAVNILAGVLNGFKCSNLVVDNCRLGAIQGFASPDDITPQNVVFENVTVTNSNKPFEIVLFAGLTLNNFQADNCAFPAVLGYVGGWKIRHLSGRNWKFNNCGGAAGAALELRGMDNYYIEDVTFRNCNTNAVVMRGGNPFRDSILKNWKFINDVGGPYAIVNAVNALVADGDGNPDFYNSTVIAENWELNGLATPGFSVKGLPVRTVPTSGRWERGTVVPTSKTLERGSPREFYCFATNTLPATPNFVAVADPAAKADPVSPIANEAVFWNKTSNLSVNNGRFTSTGGGQYASAASQFQVNNVNPYFYVEFNAGYSGTSGVYVGAMNEGTANGSLAQMRAGMWHNNGVMHAIINGGGYGPLASYMEGDHWRMQLTYNNGPNNFTVKWLKNSVEVGTPVVILPAGASFFKGLILMANSGESFQLTHTGFTGS